VRALANDQQRAAIDARGSVFVAAGAGTGKTAVLVERFVRAVAEDGLDVDSLLVITYTERAAGELRARIRSALVERGRSDLALELDGAWVSTIHGFCRRILGAYPLAAGIDPSFRVLDEPQALVLQAEAFSTALEEFCAADEPDRRRRGSPSDARGRVRDTPLGRAGARAGVGNAGAAARAGPGAPRHRAGSPQ
jgi:ATP-dependent exoDNAse (exonuclease V) beta subunit